MYRSEIDRPFSLPSLSSQKEFRIGVYYWHQLAIYCYPWSREEGGEKLKLAGVSLRVWLHCRAVYRYQS